MKLKTLIENLKYYKSIGSTEVTLDINDLLKLSEIPNVIGAICGVSIYEKKLDLKEALQKFK